MNDTERAALEKFLAVAAGARSARIEEARLLSGGAVQENWRLALVFDGGERDGGGLYILRCDSPTAGVAISRGRAEEYALLKAAAAAGVAVPEPLWSCDDASVIGRPFFVMRCLSGLAAGHLLVRDAALSIDRPALAQRLGRELAAIHSIRPPRADLGFLALPDGPPALATIAAHRAFLDSQPTPYPALEWGLRWLERHAPPRGALTLCHRDFRTGNYMVDAQGLTGILDWEFAGWGDPLEDIGWFCAKCWRFGRDDREAGGIGDREDFYRGYEAGGGGPIERAAVRHWEIMAHMTWAIVAIQQAERHLSGAENSLLLALTGHIVPELEWEILAMTESD